MINFRLRFGLTPSTFWKARDTDELKELVNICFNTSSVEKAKRLGSDFIGSYAKEQDIKIEWQNWIPDYVKSNPYLPGIQKVIVVSRYSKEVDQGRFYFYLFMEI